MRLEGKLGHGRTALTGRPHWFSGWTVELAGGGGRLGRYGTLELARQAMLAWGVAWVEEWSPIN